MADTAQTQKRRIRTRNVVIRVILLLVFCWSVIAVIRNLLIPAMSNQYMVVENGNQAITNVGLALSFSEEVEIPLELQLIQSFRGEYRESAVRLILSGAALTGQQLEETAEQVCLTKLWVVEPLDLPEDAIEKEEVANLVAILNQTLGEKTLSVEFDNFCAERDGIKLQSGEDQAILVGVLPFATGLSPYFYPFDSRSLDLEIWVETEITYNDDSRKTLITAPNIGAQYNFPDWQLSLFKDQTTPEDGQHPITRLQLSMQRPFANRLLTATLLLSLFVIILLLSFTKNIDAFIQASVAVLLTLLGIQDLLVPAGKTQTTIVDQTILVLYILFALVVLAHLTIKPIWERTTISEVDEVDEDEKEED
ncbi:MAG: hypothetical protein ACK2U1_25905 [Anaerolineales bacterium]